MAAVVEPSNIEEASQTREEAPRILKKCGRKRRNLIAILQEIQDKLGYLPRQTTQETAQFLDLPEMDVCSVVTFDNQFRLNPPARHSVRV